MMPIEEIGVEDLEDHLAAGGVLLDVRQPEEWDEAHLEGATLVPLAELPDRLEEVPEGCALVVMCRSGARSMRAAEFLEVEGHEVRNLRGGILAWIDSGRPTAGGSAGA